MNEHLKSLGYPKRDINITDNDTSSRVNKDNFSFVKIWVKFKNLYKT